MCSARRGGDGRVAVERGERPAPTGERGSRARDGCRRARPRSPGPSRAATSRRSARPAPRCRPLSMWLAASSASVGSATSSTGSNRAMAWATSAWSSRAASSWSPQSCVAASLGRPRDERALVRIGLGRHAGRRRAVTRAASAASVGRPGMLRVNHAAVARASRCYRRGCRRARNPIPAPGAAPGSPESEQAWLDLFYDLVFVAAILILSSGVLARRARRARRSGSARRSSRSGGCGSPPRCTPTGSRPTTSCTASSCSRRCSSSRWSRSRPSDGAHAHPEFVSICYSLLTLTVALTYACRHVARARRQGGVRAPAGDRIHGRRARSSSWPASCPKRLASLCLGHSVSAVTIAPAIAHCTTAPPLEEHHLARAAGRAHDHHVR